MREMGSAAPLHSGMTADLMTKIEKKNQ